MENKVDLKNKAIIYGLVYGVISILLGVLYMFIAKDITSFMIFYVLMILMKYGIPIALIVFFVLRLRKDNGGYWSFKTALQHIFIFFAVSIVISTLGSRVFNAAVPDIQADMINNSLNLTIESMESFGADEDVIDETVANLEKQREKLEQISIGQIISGILVEFLLYFAFALILAAIFKKEKPIFYKMPEEGEVI